MSPKFLRGLRRREPVRSSGWPALSGRKRVLVEHDDFAELYAIEHILSDEGYDVVACAGPDAGEGRTCPLVEGEGCALLDGADLVVHGLRISESENQAVLRAIRDRYRDTPVIVEVPTSRLEQFHTMLEGCRTVRYPATRDRLVEAVDELLPTG